MSLTQSFGLELKINKIRLSKEVKQAYKSNLKSLELDEFNQGCSNTIGKFKGRLRSVKPFLDHKRHAKETAMDGR